MSVILKTHAIDMFDNVFIFYDFQQVRDAIMIAAFFEELRRWEKIFIYYSGDRWGVEKLKEYFNSKKYEWICSKLNMIFQRRENSSQFDGINICTIPKIDSVFALDWIRLFSIVAISIPMINKAANEAALRLAIKQ